ncbi:hypothetical protein [Candidatus Phycosocius spiralis]|uniref:Uncharacterized protein n=1 Tax=Candidatus Phycosocius spiralis TaxID=2815099 RepID=A0ABQ4PXI0_9PROT|nr:hypothetical protein [Candidatus Phycosocius spiralis]GIU67747.1 hypothetical protein PsB1_1901 [Candidatus Phycosocius spiralis]
MNVTATGLKLQVLWEVDFEVDFSKTFSYKGIMYSGVHNLASAFGYTNASWTLRADLTAEYICRLLSHMDQTGQTKCKPKIGAIAPTLTPWLAFRLGYVTRAMASFPKQGDVASWNVHQNYMLDRLAFRFGTLDDQIMRFSKPPRFKV